MDNRKVREHIARTELHFARDLIDQAMAVLLAHQLLQRHKIQCAPDLLPVVESLLIRANGDYLYKAEKELSK